MERLKDAQVVFFFSRQMCLLSDLRVGIADKRADVGWDVDGTPPSVHLGCPTQLGIISIKRRAHGGSSSTLSPLSPPEPRPLRA